MLCNNPSKECVVELSHYLKVYPSQDKPGRMLLVATRRCSVLELSETLWGKICTKDDLSETEISTLTRLGVLASDRDAERDEMRVTFDTINGTSRRIAATVTLTLECNLACPYCYEDPFRGHFVMSRDTADLLVQRLTERMIEGLDVSVKFYGGEALLQLKMLKDIASRLAEAAAIHSVAFSFNLFSNGVLLTPHIVQQLLPLGLSSIRLTIDGPPDIHNVQRPFVSGAGSFAKIVTNLLAIHKLVPVDLGGNYTRDNYRRFAELLDILIEEGIEPSHMKEVSFNAVMPKADGSVAGDHGSACACSAEPWAIEANLFLRGAVIRRGFPVAKIKPGACMIEFKNDIVVGYDGTLYKCPVFMGQEEMRVGTLASGITDYRESHNLDVWKNDECLECAYLPLCFGGCRFFSKLKTGTIDGVDCRRGMLDASLETIVRQDLGMGRVE